MTPQPQSSPTCLAWYEKGHIYEDSFLLRSTRRPRPFSTLSVYGSMLLHLAKESTVRSTVEECRFHVGWYTLSCACWNAQTESYRASPAHRTGPYLPAFIRTFETLSCMVTFAECFIWFIKASSSFAKWHLRTQHSVWKFVRSLSYLLSDNNSLKYSGI